MTRNRLAIASALLTAAMALAALLVGRTLPEDMVLPVHWDLSGTPDAWAGKWLALFTPAIIAGLVSLVFYFLPSIEPRGKNLLRSQGLYLWGWAAVLFMTVAIDIVVLSLALGWGLPVNHVIVGSFGVIFVIIGNQLGKSRSMFFIGLRTPWTLASEEVWVRTHRLAGKLMVGGGLIVVVAALLPLPSGLLASVLFATILVSALVPAVWSYLLWRRETRADHPSG